MTAIPPKLGLLPQATQPVSRPMFRSLSIAASGLSAQRARMETVAQNLANAETTNTPEGGPYKRRVVRMEPGMGGGPGGVYVNPPGQLPYVQAPFGVPAFSVPALSDSADSGITGLSPVGGADGTRGVRVAGVEEDQSEGPLVYDPGHPDANAQGYVRYPNVRVTDEMVDLMDARRIYEANATVFQSAKAMLKRALDI